MMLKVRVCEDRKLTIWNSFASTGFSWFWQRDVKSVPVFGRKLLGQGSKLDTKISHRKDTREGWLGVRAMPSEEQVPFSQTGDLLTLQTTFTTRSCLGSWFPWCLKRDVIKPGGEKKKEKCVKNHRYRKRGGGEEGEKSTMKKERGNIARDIESLSTLSKL